MNEQIESAIQSAENIVKRADEYDAQLQKIQETRYYTPEHQQKLRQEAKAEFEQYVGPTYRAAMTRIDEAVAAATRVLRQPGDERVEAGKLAAADRVRRYLDNGGPAAAIQGFTETEDAAGLRRLRDELRSYMATQGLTPVERQRMTEGLELAVDRALEPLVSGTELDAVRARIRADDARARVKAAAEWAFSKRSAASRVVLAYSRAS